MTLPSTKNDREYQSFVELGSSGVPARRVVLYDASGSPLYTVGTPADGQPLVAAPTISTQNLLYNGSTLDLERGNQQGTLLTSATRNATTASADQINYNARGVLLFLDVSAASGTGGVRAIIDVKDPVSGNYKGPLNTTPTFRTAVGTYVYLFYPGSASAGGLEQNNQVVLPRLWRATVQHSDATNYSYSLAYCYVL